MTDLPQPPIPAEVVLRDFDYMPLMGDRLFSSDTWLMASPEGRCAALQLWWAAWRQEPAGSLPDNDRLLANLAGFGVAVSAFQKVKEEAMSGFYKCSDGRLYHLVVCELAIKAWQGKRRKESENEADRERKKRKRGAEKPNTPPELDNPSGGRGGGDEAASDGKSEVSGGIPPENALKGKRREEEEIPAALLGSELPAASTPEPTEQQRANLLIRAFDDAIEAVWGEAQRRPWPGQMDGGVALRWLRAGVTAEMVRSVADARFTRMQAQGKRRPDTLSFLDGAITDTLAEAQRSGLPPPGAPVDPAVAEASRRYTEAVTAWSRDGRQGPAPTRELYGLPALGA